MSYIEVKNLIKIYKSAQKSGGLIKSLSGFFNRKYKTVKAVNDISFNIEEGELIGFIGPNGAGKTTTLKILSGILYPTSGEVMVSGYVPWERKEAFQKNFSLVAGQKNQLWWDLAPIETFKLNKEIYEIPDSDYKKRLNYLADLLKISNILETPVKKLSLGQRMKAELIAALIHGPKILFLDEPTIGLDLVAQKNMHDFIKNYNKNFGATIILTSHYMDDVEKLAKRVIIIDLGKIVFDGKLSDIVKKFAKNKLITLDFEKEIPKSELEKYGQIVNLDSLSAQIKVPKEQIVEATAEILKKYPIVDLKVEEPEIEEVIRTIFSRGK